MHRLCSWVLNCTSNIHCNNKIFINIYLANNQSAFINKGIFGEKIFTEWNYKRVKDKSQLEKTFIFLFLTKCQNNPFWNLCLYHILYTPFSTDNCMTENTYNFLLIYELPGIKTMIS